MSETPMTDKTREKIARENPYELPLYLQPPAGEHPSEAEAEQGHLHDAYMAGVDATLATPEIKEGQELLEKAKIEHDRGKSTVHHYYEPRGSVEHQVKWHTCACEQVYCTTCYEGCWKCGAKPLASGESR